jgi:hypothetical protein
LSCGTVFLFVSFPFNDVAGMICSKKKKLLDIKLHET